MLEPKADKNKKEQAENQNAIETSENSFWSPMRIKALIGLIIFMSVVLAIGFGFFIYKLVNTLLSKPETNEVVSEKVFKGKIQSKQMPVQSGIKLDGFKIQHLAASEKEIILYVKKEDVKKGVISEIWIVNKKTKAITAKISVQK